MSIFDESALQADKLSDAFKSAGLNEAVRFSRGEIEAAPQEIALNPNFLSIKPETIAGVCNAVGQAMTCLGLASAEQAQPERPSYADLVIA